MLSPVGELDQNHPDIFPIPAKSAEFSAVFLPALEIARPISDASTSAQSRAEKAFELIQRRQVSSTVSCNSR